MIARVLSDWRMNPPGQALAIGVSAAPVIAGACPGQATTIQSQDNRLIPDIARAVAGDDLAFTPTFAPARIAHGDTSHPPLKPAPMATT
jgi:hypothetical protein